MNSKAIRKQLLAAVAMVLVAAVALGSSTYAWFVASGTVTAKGMTVKAQSEGGLIIRYKGGAWGTVAEAVPSTTKELKPTSTEDLVSWVYAQAEKPNAEKANDKTFQDVSTKVVPEAGKDDIEKPNNYALVKLFQIRAATAQDVPKGLYVDSIDVTVNNAAPQKSMSTALRVGIKCEPAGGTPTYTIFAPVTVGGGGSANSPSTSYQVVKPNSSGTIIGADGSTKFARNTTAFAPKAVGADDAGNPKAALLDKNVVIGNTDATQVTVYVYVWFEGEDHNLNSDNFFAENLSVAVNFTSITGKTTAAATSVDLTSATVSGTTETATSPNGQANTTYYEITDALALDGVNKLYTDAASSSGLTSTSKVYVITNGTASDYTGYVKLPTGT